MRGNLIKQLEKQDGTILTSHRDKEQLLWEDFKERLGKSEFTRFGIDPSTILERRDDLGFLEEPFSNMEIDTIIKHLQMISLLDSMASVMNSSKLPGQQSKRTFTASANLSMTIMCA